MKKMFICLLVMVLLFSYVDNSYALFAWYFQKAKKVNEDKVEKAPFVIRHVSWGMTREQVMANEWYDKDSNKKDAIRINESIRDIIGWLPRKEYPFLTHNREFDYKIVYIDHNVADEKMELTYYFKKNKLLAARYRLINQPSNYIDYYNNFKMLLNYKYDKPIFDLNDWHCEMELVPPTLTEGSIYQGWASMNTMWNVKELNTIIYSRLHGGGLFRSFIDILYINKDYAKKASIKGL